jgi:putative acetyltransferase
MMGSGQGAPEVNQGSPQVSIRPIQAGDDRAVAEIVRTVLAEFCCTGAGFACADPELDHLSSHYPGGPARFFVLASAGEVVGCGGFSALRGGDPDTCELQKMYFRPAIRGRGLGRRFLAFLLAQMRQAGYRRAYLETVDAMQAARHLYESFGFRPLGSALGATGHHGCDCPYLLEL